MLSKSESQFFTLVLAAIAGLAGVLVAGIACGAWGVVKLAALVLVAGAALVAAAVFNLI